MDHGQRQLLHLIAVALILLAAGCRPNPQAEPTHTTRLEPPAPPAPTQTETENVAAPSAPRVVAPFDLPPPPPAWRAKAATRPPSRYFTDEFFGDCKGPAPIAGLGNDKDEWSLVAYRCREPIDLRNGPDPWLSDGSFFAWGARDDVVIEVIGHPRRGPRPYQFRLYVDEALGKLGPPPTPSRATAEERASVERALAKATRMLKEAARCGDKRSGEVVALLQDVRGIVLPPEMADVAKGEALVCLACDSAPPGAKPPCEYALEVLGDMRDALKRQAP